MNLVSRLVSRLVSKMANMSSLCLPANPSSSDFSPQNAAVVVKIYLINRKSDRKRYQRMKFRLLNMFDSHKIKIVQAVDKKEEIEKQCILPEEYELISKGVGGCLLSHLKAVNQFYQDFWDSSHLQKSKVYALVLEDDVLFHKQFKETIQKEICPFLTVSSTPMVLLSPFRSIAWKDVDTLKVQSSPSKKYDFFPMVHDGGIWSAAAYLISLDYAQQVIQNRYNQPIEKWPNMNPMFMLKSEFITCYSNGQFIWPPIAIEESLDSTVSGMLPEKFQYWKQFGLQNFVQPADPCIKLWKREYNHHVVPV